MSLTIGAVGSSAFPRRRSALVIEVVNGSPVRASPGEATIIRGWVSSNLARMRFLFSVVAFSCSKVSQIMLRSAGKRNR